MIKKQGKGHSKKNKVYKDPVNRFVPEGMMMIIDENNEKLGVFSKQEGLRMAEEKQLDLLCVSPKSNPMVSKIIDYGKFCYHRSKKERESKKHQHIILLKEIRITPQIGPGDLEVKVNHAIEFLKQGNKVKLSLKFRGRQMAFKEIGAQTINKFVELVGEHGKIEGNFKDQGRFLDVIIIPTKKT